MHGTIDEAFCAGDDATNALVAIRVFEWVSVEDILDRPISSFSRSLAGFRFDLRPRRSNRAAYIQYTSGSTSSPRGVEVTASGLLHNLRCIADALAIGPDDVCVTWLPHFHDMGLVGTLLAPLFVGASSVLLSPLRFRSSADQVVAGVHEVPRDVYRVS